MGLLTKEQVSAAQDLTTEEVEVPQWGGSVLVRTLTARERGQFMALLVDQRKGGNRTRLEDLQVRLCAMSIVDEQGRRMFSDSELGLLARKSARALQPIFEVAQRLSGLSDEQVEELSGNSEETPSDDSPSD